MAHIDIAVVAYRGGAPAINDLLGGHIPISFNNAPEALGQIKGGAVRALGVTTAARSSFLPDVPTIAEAGLPGYGCGVWWALLGPGGMPADVVAKIARDSATALQSPAVKERLTTVGAVPAGGSPQELDALIRSDYEKWGPIIKAAGIKAE
jgi:tripartite-type tricarboxylate transporter receptor subunit TctC